MIDNEEEKKQDEVKEVLPKRIKKVKIIENKENDEK